MRLSFGDLLPKSAKRDLSFARPERPTRIHFRKLARARLCCWADQWVKTWCKYHSAVQAMQLLLSMGADLDCCSAPMSVTGSKIR